MPTPTLRSVDRQRPPNWAVRQRDLINVMNLAAVPFVDYSTRPDGTLIQRTVWTSMDGTDNGYEAFLSLLQSHVRYFDAERRRPGLPQHVAALTEKVTAENIGLTLINTDAVNCRSVLIQSGCFAEHQFTGATIAGNDGDEQHMEVDGTRFQVHLGPSAQARICIGLKRYCHRPTYEFPGIE